MSLKGKTITINKFFGISFGHTKLKQFDLSEFDVMVFDQIYSYFKYLLEDKIFVEQNKQNKIIIATGDCK